MVVQKFGGTSVADPAAIRRLIDIVRRARERDGGGPAVVVSAMNGVTDSLLTIAAVAGSGRERDALTHVTQMRERHHAAAQDLAPTRLQTLAADIDHHFDQLSDIVKALAVLREASPRTLDIVASIGELVSSRIVTAALSEAGLPAEWVDARRAIVTNDDHTRAIPLARETQAAMHASIVPLLEAGRVPVLGGFVAATIEGQTTTLGRGGSDYSGALVGAGMNAAEIQIWTDVDGMLTADPRVVSSPRLVPQLSFAEAAELAYFGAKVLHPSTILPAVERNIPVRILNSRRPEGTGTVITAEGAPNGLPLTALASKRDVTVIDITSSRMLMAYGFLRRVFEVFERFRTAVDVVTTSEVSVSVTVDDRRDLDAIVNALRELGDVCVEGEMALLCAVGDRLRNEPETAARDSRARGVSAADDLAGGIATEHHRHHETGRSAARDGAPARGVLPVRLLIVGYGKMGRLVDRMATDQGIEIAGRVDVDGSGWTDADVAVDFTTADALLANFPRYLERRLPVVIGTTGWSAHETALRSDAERAGVGVVAAPNFSIGVNLFESIVREAARLLKDHRQYGAWIHEAHHSTKRDAPSGTALILRETMIGAGYQAGIDMSSTRAGQIPGVHTIGFDGASDTIELTHRARDRGGFASGAILAARWLQGKRGWYSMRDVLGIASDLKGTS